MKRRNESRHWVWPFGKRKKKPALRKVSPKAVEAKAKERESERLERKLSDRDLETKLRKHYARGGNLREFLTANPGVPGEQFKRCVAAVSEKGGAYDPRAVCAAAGRKKYGAKKYAAMAKAGKKRAKRGNPADLAAEVYEEFHGRPSEEIVTVTEKIHYHKNLAALGELRTLVVVARDGGRVTLSRFRKAILCTNEAKNQMFIRGGDQSVDPGAFGIRNVHEVETLGKVVELAYFTRKDHLGDEGGEAVYFHVAGETNEGGKRKMAGWAPDLVYHTIDERLEFSGGSYTIRAEGVDK
jgi:hypothetical protein